jgi:hypothetical protein
MPIPFHPKQPSTCLALYLCLLYGSTGYLIYQHCPLPLMPAHLLLWIACAWRDWHTHSNPMPYHHCVYYPPQWWQMSSTQAHQMTDAVSIPYISAYCIVLIIPDHPTYRYVQLWFDSMAREDFHRCIRHSKGYTSTGNSGVSIVGSAIAAGLG